MKFTVVIALFFFCSSLFSQAAWSQDFSSVDKDLELLETLIVDTIANTEEQQRLLENLRLSLSESGSLISGYESILNERETLLAELRARLNEMSETYRMQSALSAKYERNSRFWRNFTLIAVPTAAVISGTIVWAVMR